MFKEILQKELNMHFLSIPFAFLVILNLVLFSFNALIFNSEYQTRLERYQCFINDNAERGITDTNDFIIAIPVFIEPSKLAFISDRSEVSRPDGYYVTQGVEIEPIRDQFPSGNLFLPAQQPLDWMFILGFLYSIFAIIFSFNSISSEREQGTLTLVFSNAIPRVTLFWAKYVAVLLTLFLPLIAGSVLNLLLLSLLGTIKIKISLVVWLIFVLLCGAMAISVFVLIGLLFSTLFRHSIVALLFAAFSWIVLVIVVPGLAGILAEYFTDSFSEYQLNQKLKTLCEQPTPQSVQIPPNITSEHELAQLKQDLADYLKLVFQNQMTQSDLLEKHYMDLLWNKRYLERSLAKFSPVALLQFSVEEISNIGLGAEFRLYETLRQYKQQILQHIKQRYGEVISLESGTYYYDVTYQGEPTSLAINFGDFNAPEKLKGFPKFQMPHNLGYRGFIHSVDNLFWLIVWNVILMAIILVVVLRYDVR
ncbi:ABC transporter permease subunit [candidate division KSB1 bacterium]|nr:ABC transporter permease subunit [candidate division KSB1 bacterium]